MSRLSLRAYHFSFDLGVGSTIDGQVRAGDVRRFRTGDERHQCGDIVNTPVAVERRVGLLGRSPFARGGIQLRVDRTRLDVVNRNATVPHFSRQPLSKYLYGSLRGRVGDES